MPATIASKIPPESIWAPELITFESGSGNLRARTDAIDQLMDAKISATAPSLSIGAPPRLSVWLISTPTPPMPIRSAAAKRIVSRCVRRKIISHSAMKTGIVASITAAMPDGTRCSAQNSKP